MSLHQSFVHSIITGGPVMHKGHVAEFPSQDGAGFLDFAKNLYGKAKSFFQNKVVPFFDRHKATVLNKLSEAGKNALKIGLKTEGSLKDRLRAVGNNLKNTALSEVAQGKKALLNRLERDPAETIITV